MEKEFNGLTPIKRFFGLLKVDRQEVISIYVYALFNGLIGLSLPLGIQAIINFITTGEVSTSWILLVVLVVLGVAFSGIMQIMQLTVAENLQQKIFTRSAFEFAYRIPRIKTEAADGKYLPEFVNRFFDTLSVQKGLSKILLDFSTAAIQAGFGLILLSLYHPFFILFGFSLVVIVYLIFRFTAPLGLKTSIKESAYKYEVAHWLEELARAMETFKLAGKTDLPMEKTDKIVEGYLDSRKKHFKTLIIQYINLISFRVIITAGLLLIGGLLVINQQMNIGQFVASEIIIILVLGAVEKLITSMETIYDVLTAVEKLGNVTDLPLENDSENNIELNTDKGLSINLKGVSYAFNDNTRILKNINLNVASNARVCLSGFNGSGKSVLLHIIAGLYENYQGILSYNDVPLGNLNKEHLRWITGSNLAREDIFRGTIKENIALGRPGLDETMLLEVAEKVGLTEFVEQMPLGYNTILQPEGRDLPKTIRIKIILARCVIGNPKLIVLEDVFKQLSNYDKNCFLDYLLGEDKNWTVIAVSNEEDVAERFSKVAILNAGEVVKYGKLSDMKSESWYNKVYLNK